MGASHLLLLAPDMATACWHALVLGVVQGLTEFLPISSTAHLKVVPVLLGWGDPGVAVTAVIQLGSIAAVVGYFRHDLRRLARGLIAAVAQGRTDGQQARLGLAVAVGTVPILVVGLAITLFLKQTYEDSPVRSLAAIGVVSIVMALLLAMAERLGRRRRDLSSVAIHDGWLIGSAQVLAIIPGVSRSGSTLTAALLTGWQRAPAARFSFLLGVPAISLAGVASLRDAMADPVSGGWLPLLVGVSSAAVTSWLAIAWLLRFLQHHNTWIFVAYRLGFGVALLVLATNR